MNPSLRRPSLTRSLALTVIFSWFAWACAPAGQERVTVELFARGQPRTDEFRSADGAVIVLNEARLAFGPLYLCASATAGELCDTARVEWLDSRVIDLLDEDRQELGNLRGISGPIRSYMFDLGIVSLLGRDTPTVLPSAQSLGDASVYLEGTVQLGAQTVPFRLSLPIAQTGNEASGVPVVLSQPGAIEQEIDASTASVTVRFAVGDWLEGLDFSEWNGDRACEDGGPHIVCSGSVAETCDDDAEPVDCLAEDKVCVPDQGCVERLLLGPESRIARELYAKVVTAGPPELRFEPQR